VCVCVSFLYICKREEHSPQEGSTQTLVISHALCTYLEFRRKFEYQKL